MTDTAKLELIQCRSCKAWWSLHPYACKQCGGHDLALKPVSGAGRIKAKTTISRAPDAFWRQYVPYTVVLVVLREGVTVMGQADNDVQVEQLVQAAVQVQEERRLIRFIRVS
ncbi:hypothetical protein GSY71_13790 [Pusillimonas sp. TS35]|nr:hypothetical protein [Pusillimonas sp. TS35]